MTAKKRLLTGLQPSGTLHIGNYFGALKPFVDLYGEYESTLMIADLHALTSIKDPEALRANILNIVKDYIAAGVDPEQVTIFKQSDVPEHTELNWVFNCLVTVPFLMQAHAFKAQVDKVWANYMDERGLDTLDEYFEARKKDDPSYDAEVVRMFKGINAGLFTYPMLMAADILLYDTDVVPVGEDQRQHIEYAREAATKFNNAFGELFSMPEEKILKGVGIVPGTDGQKMSKSYGNTIPLFGTKDEVAKAVMSIVTDSPNSNKMLFVQKNNNDILDIDEIPFARNVFLIHSLFRDQNELVELYNENINNYKALKEALIEDVEAHVAPMRAKREAITDEEVKTILEKGAEKARVRAQEKMAEVRKTIGVAL